MLKKIFAAAAAASVIMTASSCGENVGGQTPEAAETAETTASGKKLIKLYDYGMTSDQAAAVTDFNKANGEYEIEVTDNFSLDNNDVLTRLNLEIMSGSAPDIVSAYGLPMESYIEKDLLASFYDFIDSDPEMRREDFLENIFKAYEVDGELYESVTGFYLNIIAAKNSFAGEMRGRTADDYIDLAEKYPDKKFVDMQWSKERAFGFFMGEGCKSFIDEETGKCDFDNEGFLRILRFCNTFPDRVDDSYMLAPDWRRSEFDDLRDEKTLFMSYACTINDFYGLRKMESALGEPVVSVGYPYIEGNGAVIQSAETGYAVFKASDVKEGAWEFLRYFYSDEYQKKILSSYMLPVKRSALEFAAEDAKKGFYLAYSGEYTDEHGINTDEDNRRIMSLIEGAVCRAGTEGSVIYDIINEEAAAYFSGQKSAEEVAEIIQNRVQNYLDENR